MKEKQYRFLYIVMLITMLFGTFLPSVSSVYALANDTSSQVAQPTDEKASDRNREGADAENTSNSTSSTMLKTTESSSSSIMTTSSSAPSAPAAESSLTGSLMETTSSASVATPAERGRTSFFAAGAATSSANASQPANNPASQPSNGGPALKKEGDTYVPGNGYIASFQLNGDDSVMTNAWTSLDVSIGLALNDNSEYTNFKAVTVKFEFWVPERTASNGKIRPEVIDGQLSQVSRRDKQVIDGVNYWKIEGYRTITDAMPGVSHFSLLKIWNEMTSQNEIIPVKGKVSLNDEPDKVFEFEKDIKITIKSSKDAGFNIFSHIGSGRKPLKISGYYNKKTGAYYSNAQEAAQDPGAVYGRFYTFESVISPDFRYAVFYNWADGYQRLSPTKPQSWDLDYYVSVTKDKETVKESDERFKPVLVDEKFIQYSDQDHGLIHNKDMSIGGLIPMDVGTYMNGGNGPEYISGHFGPTDANETYRADAGLTAQDNGERISHTLIAAPNDEKKIFSFAGTLSVFFVPVNEADSKDTTREIHFELKNFKATLQNGEEFTETKLNDNNAVYTVPQRSIADGLGMSQKIDETSRANGVYRVRGVALRLDLQPSLKPQLKVCRTML